MGDRRQGHRDRETARTNTLNYTFCVQEESQDLQTAFREREIANVNKGCSRADGEKKRRRGKGGGKEKTKNEDCNQDIQKSTPPAAMV